MEMHGSGASHTPEQKQLRMRRGAFRQRRSSPNRTFHRQRATWWRERERSTKRARMVTFPEQVLRYMVGFFRASGCQTSPSPSGCQMPTSW